MQDETITTKMDWYDLAKYKDEIGSFIRQKRNDLDVTSTMYNTYKELVGSVYPGSIKSNEERFSHAQEMFKVYKAALIESSLSGYSALLEIVGDDAYSTLKIPRLKRVMTDQFKSMALLEKLSDKVVDDWILKGEAVSFIKLKEDKEEYRIKVKAFDEDAKKEVMSFTLKEGVAYNHLEVERIDPLDFFVDAYDYDADPRGCVKIIRTWISAKELLTSNAYPMLTDEDKKNLIAKIGRNGTTYTPWSWNQQPTVPNSSKTNAKKLEVLTFYGDYITNDNKVLSNIKAVLVGGITANVQYNSVNTNRIIYAAYKVDDDTHRGIAPITSTKTINKLANRVADMFIQNLDDTSNPIMLVPKGTLKISEAQTAREKRFLEYNPLSDRQPDWLQTPQANPNGINLLELIISQSKNTLGLNQYIAGDTSGAVRTARESAILFQKANARMRVETDVFSYNYMLRLFVSFYAFNRELALAAGMPLAEIYADPRLKVSISTNASRADKEGELNKLLEILSMPIGQMIFSNLEPDQIVMAVRYLMAKAELSDADNLLGLQEEIDENIPIDGYGAFEGVQNTPDAAQQEMIKQSPQQENNIVQQLMNNNTMESNGN